MRKLFFRAPYLCAIVVILSLAACLVPPSVGATPKVARPASKPTTHLPLRFEENRGQSDAHVRYLAREPGATIFFTPTEIVLSLTGNHAKRAAVVRLRPVGANRTPLITGSGQQSGTSNYISGRDTSKWVRGVRGFSRVRYHDLWPGVDVVFYEGRSGALEYDVVAAPHAALNAAFDVVGATSLALRRGGLQIATPAGTLTHTSPHAYQVVDRKRKNVPASIRLHGSRFSFRAGRHDSSKQLVIDPQVMDYSTYLGGADVDQGSAIAVDSSGSAYVTGSTDSADFPVTPGAFQTTLAVSPDAYVTKLSPDGTSLVYSTYIGGSDSDQGTGIAVDGNGSAYITGDTSSTDFPVTLGAFSGSLGGFDDAFVTKLSADGTSLLYSTYLGGSGGDSGAGIAVDQAGSAYVAGLTDSANLPVTAGSAQTTVGGSSDAFVSKISTDGTSLVYSTYLGGSDIEEVGGVAVDATGSAYVSGRTQSTDFPVTNAFQPAFGGFVDAFATKVSPSGTSFDYSTYLGGSSYDTAFAVAVDSTGHAYVAGTSESSDFPVTPGAFATSIHGINDAFVTKLSDNGMSLDYSTYLGGANTENGQAIAVDAAGSASVTGETDSADFPVTPGAVQPTYGGTVDAFVTTLSVGGDSLDSSTYLGGPGFEQGFGLAVDDAGGTFVTGRTNSIDFPVTAGAFQTSPGGSFDGFVTKITSAAGGAPNTAIRHMSIRGHTARFWFRSSTPNATFLCSLDRHRFRPCASPKTYRHLRPGSHLFRVKAKDASGNVDPTAARRRFTIGSRPRGCFGVCTG